MDFTDFYIVVYDRNKSELKLMKNKYIFIGIFALIFLVSAINVSAVVDLNSNIAYYMNLNNNFVNNITGEVGNNTNSLNITGKINDGKYLQYNSRSYIEYTLNSSLLGDPTYTANAWVYMNYTTDSTCAGLDALIGWGTNNNNQENTLFMSRSLTIDCTDSNQTRLAIAHYVTDQYSANGMWSYNTWNMVTWIKVGNLNKLYVNGINVVNLTLASSNFGASTFKIGSRPLAINHPSTLRVDEVSLYLREFSNEEVFALYQNNSAGITYPFTAPSVPTTNGITFVSQVPANLTAFSLFTQNFNVTYNFTNQTTVLSNISLNYTLTGSRSCLMFVNGSCMYQNNTLTSVSATSSVVSGSSTIASFVLNENNLYPATAIRDSTFFNQNHSVFTMTGNNDFLAFKLLNISNTSRSNLLELMINDTAISRIYLCNSSINLAGAVNPLTNTNCQEIGSVDATGFNHSHGSYSGHNIVPFSIVNGTIGGSGITVTNSMWILARGNSLGLVRIGYINNGSLATSVYSTANGGNTWTDRSASFTIDSHLHQYSLNEFVNYYATARFNSTLNVSATVNEFIDVPPVNPSPAIITVPFNTQQGSRFLNITYLNATANTFGSSIVKYNITLLNENLTFVQTITANNGLNNSYLYDLYAQNLSLAKYYVRVFAFDNLNNSAFDEESFNLTRNAILNVTLYDQTTNVSISNFSMNVTDHATSVTEYFSTSGSLINVDVIKSHNYTIHFDANNYALTVVNVSLNTSFIQKLNQSLYKTNSVQINVYDEGSLALITNVTGGGTMNVTFISDGGSFMYNTTTGTLFVSNITAGTYEVKFNAPLYAQRSYYLTITNRSTQTLNAYLSQSTINLLLTYVNKETGELVENVGVNVYKIINGSWTAVATGFTDITGRLQFSVTTNTNYRFSSTITGYDDKTFNLNPVIFTAYTIQLTKQQASGSQLDFANINVYLINTTFTNNGSNTFSWQISAPNGNLEQYAYSLSTQCKNISSFSGVNAFGGINVDTFNLSCASSRDHVTLKYNYTLTGGELRSFVYTYSILGNATQGSFMANNDETYGMGMFERVLIVVLITIVMAGLITKFSNIVAGLGAGLLIMSYLSYIGFIEWWLIAPTLLVGFVLITSWSTSR